MAEKYYWLKLKRDFFKRHDIRIIEGLQNGKDYILFYLKLLCESVDHNGNLRFSEQIPYNEDMLATITNTNVDIVRSAVKIFVELGMMEIMDDGTFYMTEVNKMLGAETSWAEKKREYRQKQKELGHNEDNVLTLSDKSKSIEIEKEKDKERTILTDSKKESAYFKKPTVEEVAQYCKERNNGIDAQSFIDFYESKGWMVGKNHMKDWKAAIRTWESRDKKDSGKTNGVSDMRRNIPSKDDYTKGVPDLDDPDSPWHV